MNENRKVIMCDYFRGWGNLGILPEYVKSNEELKTVMKNKGVIMKNEKNSYDNYHRFHPELIKLVEEGTKISKFPLRVEVAKYDIKYVDSFYLSAGEQIHYLNAGNYSHGLCIGLEYYKKFGGCKDSCLSSDSYIGYHQDEEFFNSRPSCPETIIYSSVEDRQAQINNAKKICRKYDRFIIEKKCATNEEVTSAHNEWFKRNDIKIIKPSINLAYHSYSINSAIHKALSEILKVVDPITGNGETKSTLVRHICSELNDYVENKYK